MTPYALAESYLRHLIAIPSVNPDDGEQQIADYIVQELASCGFETRLESAMPGRPNVTACSGGSFQREIILTGHMDVVPYGSGWSSDPTVPVLADGRIYGRGACDMKGGIAAMMAAAVTAREKGLLKNSSLTLAFVADEEIGGTGSRRFVEKHPPKQESYVIIGEPTMLRPIIAHRGMVRLSAEIQGIQCHAGNYREDNVFTCLAQFLLALRARNRRAAETAPELLPPSTISATIVQGGIKENIIPGSCSVFLDCRTVPGENAATITAELEELFHQAVTSSDTKLVLETIWDASPAVIPADSPICLSALAAYRKVFGCETSPGAFTGSTDMPIFLSGGYRQILLCGPGHMSQAHQANEFLTLEQLHKAVDFYLDLCSSLDASPA